LALVALGSLVFMVLACFVGAHFAPSPTEQHLLEQPAGPTWSHWFGTDELSRDSLSRVLHGGQISLRVAFGVAILSTIIGVVIGSLAGFYRGWLDNLLMRFTDLWIALPALPILAVAVSIGTVDLGPFGTLEVCSGSRCSCRSFSRVRRARRPGHVVLRSLSSSMRTIGARTRGSSSATFLPNCSADQVSALRGRRRSSSRPRCRSSASASSRPPQLGQPPDDAIATLGQCGSPCSRWRSSDRARG
jgi:hypothetical protein